MLEPWAEISQRLRRYSIPTSVTLWVGDPSVEQKSSNCHFLNAEFDSLLLSFLTLLVGQEQS